MQHGLMEVSSFVGPQGRVWTRMGARLTFQCHLVKSCRGPTILTYQGMNHLPMHLLSGCTGTLLFLILKSPGWEFHALHFVPSSFTHQSFVNDKWQFHSRCWWFYFVFVKHGLNSQCCWCSSIPVRDHLIWLLILIFRFLLHFLIKGIKEKKTIKKRKHGR